MAAQSLRRSQKPISLAALQNAANGTLPTPLGSSSNRHARTMLRYLRKHATLNAPAQSRPSSGANRPVGKPRVLLRSVRLPSARENSEGNL
eukprot:CAMPEP_0115709850 /NCGR_PEP_ID=MMETSP0272-20121206/72699_1 /TAXON_ID=71861 /ORGANISM="Scrippsiella trochoidea, Strain CCMP3099" /LENGTH=90 /DNA_ID=CAMNT_0003151503 /DNA_START=252 /DNA_END=520 /DNA_ORIENTATION=-